MPCVDGKIRIKKKTVKAMAQLKQEGKIGISFLAKCLLLRYATPVKVPPISTVEVKCSPAALDIECEGINLLSSACVGSWVFQSWPTAPGARLTCKWYNLSDYLEECNRRR